MSDWKAPLGVTTSYHKEYIFVYKKKILYFSYPSYKTVRTQQSNYSIQHSCEHFGFTWSLKSSLARASPRLLGVSLDSIPSHWTNNTKSARKGRGILLILGVSRRFSKPQPYFRPHFLYHCLDQKGNACFGLKQLKKPLRLFWFEVEALIGGRGKGIIPWDKHSLYDPIEDTLRSPCDRPSKDKPSPASNLLLDTGEVDH